MSETGGKAAGPGSEGPLVKEVYVEAEDATVFSYFTDPTKIARWMGVTRQVEPRPGGVFEVQVTARNRARGEYKEVSPNHRVVLTWGWANEGAVVKPGATTLTIDLKPKPPGTMVTLTHSGLWGEAAASHSMGWDHYLERFAAVVEGRDPGPDPWWETPPG